MNQFVQVGRFYLQNTDISAIQDASRTPCFPEGDWKVGGSRTGNGRRDQLNSAAGSGQEAAKNGV